MTNQQLAAERLSHLEMGGVWIVKQGAVNLSDLCESLGPGQRIVRIHPSASKDDIRFMPVGDVEQLGCIAGWISDESEVDGSRDSRG